MRIILLVQAHFIAVCTDIQFSVLLHYILDMESRLKADIFISGLGANNIEGYLKKVV